MTDEIKEEIINTVIQSNKDIDLAYSKEQEIYYRAWLGGNLEIVRILEKHYGKIIDDDEIMKESKEEVRAAQVELEADGYADGELVYDFGKCPECGWQFEEGDKDWEEPYCCHCGKKLKWFETEEEE